MVFLLLCLSCIEVLKKCTQMTHTVTSSELEYLTCNDIRIKGLSGSGFSWHETCNPMSRIPIDEIWQVIGYIVREAVNKVHEALAANKAKGCT